MPRKRKGELPPLEVNKNESVGQRIARIRKQKGLTQNNLAESIGIKRTLVTDYEIGRLHLNDEMVIRFALALGVSSDEILGLKDVPVQNELPSLKITKRIKKIENLPAQDQKKVLQNIDLILAGIESK